MILEKDFPRFRSKIALPDEQGCMLWKGKPKRSGYGQFSVRGNTFQPHRIALWLATGVTGQVAQHSCDVPLCCSPAHLSWGTYLTNNQDMAAKGRHWQQQKTHCPRGHLLSPGNLVLSKEKAGIRQCRTCHRNPRNGSMTRRDPIDRTEDAYDRIERAEAEELENETEDPGTPS